MLMQYSTSPLGRLLGYGQWSFDRDLASDRFVLATDQLVGGPVEHGGRFTSLSVLSPIGDPVGLYRLLIGLIEAQRAKVTDQVSATSTEPIPSQTVP